MYRSRKAAMQYQEYLSLRRQVECEFCQDLTDQLVAEREHVYIMRNLFPYAIWDRSDVTDHLMIVPRQHTDTLSALSPAAKLAYFETMSEYEAKGYDIYARTAANTTKSIPHQHTHLIKLDRKQKKLVAYLRRPYFLFHR
ncbi:HIT domain-containing protein [Candidatus Parcubacteria bacterium]|nr:HIT domain-containing protein [Candidatus Parcubacteria bacterium]